MTGLRLLGIVFIVCGALGLAHGGFSYTQDTTTLKLGPLEVSMKERKTVDVPAWASIGALVAGGLLLVWGGKRKRSPDRP